jgi:hypothetical protein
MRQRNRIVPQRIAAHRNHHARRALAGAARPKSANVPRARNPRGQRVNSSALRESVSQCNAVAPKTMGRIVMASIRDRKPPRRRVTLHQLGSPKKISIWASPLPNSAVCGERAHSARRTPTQPQLCVIQRPRLCAWTRYTARPNFHEAPAASAKRWPRTSG